MDNKNFKLAENIVKNDIQRLKDIAAGHKKEKKFDYANIINSQILGLETALTTFQTFQDYSVKDKEFKALLDGTKHCQSFDRTMVTS